MLDTSTYDVGDEVQVKEKKTKTRLIDEDWNNTVKKLLDTYEGRFFIWCLLEKAGIFEASGPVNNPLYLAHREGKRELGLLFYHACLQVDPDFVAKLRADEKKRQEKAR